jgi:nitrate reductase beta subunit
MSEPDDSEPAGIARGKVDDDDHDLLTFGEAGERLRIEIAAIRTRLAELEAAGDSDAVQKAQSRLGALRAATARNTAQSLTDANFEKFFGYTGKAQRNLR